MRSAEVYATLLKSEEYGILANDVSVDFNKVQLRKENAVEQLHRGLQHLMRKHGIQIIHGKGRIIGPSIFSPKSGSLAVELADGEMETVVSKNLIIATGTRPRSLPGLLPDGEFILTSDDALRLDKLPQSMLIIGGGVIGVEWASMLHDFGVEVTLVESASRLLPGEDSEISAELQRSLQKRGVRILTGVNLDLNSVSIDGEICIQAETTEGKVLLNAAKMLVSVGRQANVEELGLENTDIRVENGYVAVNGYQQTGEPHIYAIGDVTGGIQLAHAAAHEGLISVEHLSGQKPAALSARNYLNVCTVVQRRLLSVTRLNKQKATAMSLKQLKFRLQQLGRQLSLEKKYGRVR